ncbi:MAG: ATP-dependent DNA helicase RecG [Planctomycetes bacterium]|nr:ATP-dependent DNA helicase RecG [Planctomycetota bacterium]
MSAAPSPLAAPLTTLAGVGPARAGMLAELGLGSVRDLLLFAPRRLERTGERCLVREAVTRTDGEVSVLGTLRGLRLFRAGRRRAVLSLDVVDESGALRALFFNQPWQFERLRALAAAQKTVELSGRIGNTKQGPALLVPRVDADPPATRAPELVPVYATTAGLGQELLRGLTARALERFGAELAEPLGADVLDELELVPLPAAVRELHRPSSPEAFTVARRRLVFERLLVLQARLARTRAAREHSHARVVPLAPDGEHELLAALPFAATAGQRRVLREVLTDMSQPRAMRRLLQGDVGSGKTVVALLACAAVARAGGQAALLVPTELLAEQHYFGARTLLERLDLRAVLLVGSLRAAARRAALEEAASGRAQLVLGTHALLAPDLAFARLELVVVDEQQRFGVVQKQALLEKRPQANDVHALLMTATPIPRTLALCYYGDLETSLLKERPSGRGAVETRVVTPDARPGVLRFLLERARAGEGIFWVCPRILAEEEAAADARDSRAEVASAEDAARRLRASALAASGVELVHGRLTSAQRAQALERFKRGSARVLVGTSMIEVGLDVPTATVMVIEGAERFGLSQLHQLRGRVGRSQLPGWCFLLATGAGTERLRFLERTHDGFEIAEEDLRRRGMGDLVGLRQAGANLEGLDEADLELELVRRARELLLSDALLRAHYADRARDAALV